MKKTFTITCYEDDSIDTIKQALLAEDMEQSLRKITKYIRARMLDFEIGNNDLMFKHEQIVHVEKFINECIVDELKEYLA